MLCSHYRSRKIRQLEAAASSLNCIRPHTCAAKEHVRAPARTVDDLREAYETVIAKHSRHSVSRERSVPLANIRVPVPHAVQACAQEYTMSAFSSTRVGARAPPSSISATGTE